MKTEYILTTQQKAKLADIDRQIDMLLREKADIYMHANVRYVTETQEEFDAAQRLQSMIYDRPVISKEGIAKIIFEKEKNKNG